MINEAEQKLYRILFNHYTKHRSMPPWSLLKARTGLSQPELIKRLESLQEAGHILWDDPDSLESVRMNKDPFMKSPPLSSGSAYFMDY